MNAARTRPAPVPGVDAFDALLRAQPSPEARERLHEKRRELVLNDNDALWGLLQVVLDYQASLGPRPAAPPPAPGPEAVWVFKSWQVLCASLAVPTGALALAFCVGLHWGRGLPPATSWIRAWLSVPAGWMMFLLVMPFLVQGALSSWRTRKSERTFGWVLLCAFGCALCASVTALAWLIY